MSYALRPALPADHADLAILFQASIEELAGDAYDDAQRAAWAAKAEDEALWAKHLAGCLVLIAEEDGEPVGFVAMRDNTVIENVHVHPDMAFMGVGAQLLDAMGRLAQARGSLKLSAAATDNATAFFERIGFAAVRRSTINVGEVWLPSTIMEKTLGGEDDELEGGGP